jgi:hypothetical protein
MAGAVIVRHTRQVDLEDSEEAAAAGQLVPSDWNGDGAHEVVGAAPIDSPDFLNEPTAPTPPLGDTSRRLATMEALDAALHALVTVNPTPVAFAQSPYAVLLTDTALYVDSSGGDVVIQLQPAAARLGRLLEVLDVSGNAAAVGHNISIVANGVETVAGLNPLLIETNYGGYRLYPATGKYVIAP